MLQPFDPNDAKPELRPELSANAKVVLQKRYLWKSMDNTIQETPAQLFWRVAKHVANAEAQHNGTEEDIEQLAQKFYHLMASLTFLPNSPTLMNAGRPEGQLSACFVLPVEDSLNSIFETLKDAAIIHQSGGGTGFSFSKLRPKGDIVQSTMGVSSGPVSFMEVYNAATEAIKQGGTRRGANMGILRVDHPDIEAFISCKADLSNINNFNISVAITDAFMHAVEANMDFDLINPATGKVVKTIKAKPLFELIATQAWQTGEPGLVFIDRINQTHALNSIGVIESTNPCGEVPLLAYEACNLGSVNLSTMVTTDKQVDWEKLKDTIGLSTHFLDNVITQNHYPLPQIKNRVEANRKIGLGVMGWADMLIQLGIPYNSNEAVHLAKALMSFMEFHSKKTSVQLARQKGAFPTFNQSNYRQENWLMNQYQNSFPKQEWEVLSKAITDNGLRNATTTCIAPTGTISIIAGASGGIEPLFSLAFERNIMDGTRLLEVNPWFKKVLEEHHLYSDALIEEVAQHGSIQHITALPDAIKRVFVTAHDIAPEWHIKMQGAFQEFCDNAVSKTINFTEAATIKDITKTYWQAWESNVIKGITVYRNNCRASQPMNLKASSDTPKIVDSEKQATNNSLQNEDLQETDAFCDTDNLHAPWQCRDCD